MRKGAFIDHDRLDAQHLSLCERGFARLGALKRRLPGRHGTGAGPAASELAKPGLSLGAKLAVALDAKRKASRILGSRDRRDMAIIDGLEEPALHAASLEPSLAKALDRHMRHIGVDLDPWHEAATKTETARGLIVMNAVFRGDRRVECLNAVNGGLACLHAFHPKITL